MKAVVVYESMYGNTRVVAEAVGRGLAATAEVAVVPVAEAGPERLAGADLRHIRAQSRFLVTIGACATAGGVQALRKLAGRDGCIPYFDRAYGTT